MEAAFAILEQSGVLLGGYECVWEPPGSAGGRKRPHSAFPAFPGYVLSSWLSSGSASRAPAPGRIRGKLIQEGGARGTTQGCWGHLGAISGRFGSNAGSSSGHLGLSRPSWRAYGAVLVAARAILAVLEAILAVFESILGHPLCMGSRPRGLVEAVVVVSWGCCEPPAPSGRAPRAPAPGHIQGKPSQIGRQALKYIVGKSRLAAASQWFTVGWPRRTATSLWGCSRRESFWRGPHS